MRGSFLYHGALAPLDDACREAGDGYACISHLMANPKDRSGLARKLTVAWRHLGLVFILPRYRGKQCILVRDFSTIPLAIVFPLIRWKRHDMLFLVNHNLQWALLEKRELSALRRLSRWECRLVFLEEVPFEALSHAGIAVTDCHALLHPVPSSHVVRTRSGGVEVVGLVGQYRPEKGLDEMLRILEPLAGKYRVVLALPNPDVFRSHSSFASDDWFRLVDTTRHEDYQKAIAQCDVIVLNHPSEHYSCRASGLVADAAAAHVPVVVRNLPMLRHQIEVPVSIGECFDDIAQVPECIERISARLSSEAYDFKAYREGRDVPALAQQLMEMCVE